MKSIWIPEANNIQYIYSIYTETFHIVLIYSVFIIQCLWVLMSCRALVTDFQLIEMTASMTVNTEFTATAKPCKSYLKAFKCKIMVNQQLTTRSPFTWVAKHVGTLSSQDTASQFHILTDKLIITHNSPQWSKLLLINVLTLLLFFRSTSEQNICFLSFHSWIIAMTEMKVLLIENMQAYF